MATNQGKAKRTTKSTSTSKSASATSKTSAQKKAPAAKKVSAKKQPKMQSFKLAKEPEPFMYFKITDQTIYWLIIAVMSITFVLWILKVQTDIDALYTQIEYMQQQDDLSQPLVPADTDSAE